MKRLLIPCLCLLFINLYAQQQRKHSIFSFDADPAKAMNISFVGDTSAPSAWGKQYDRALDSQYHLQEDFTFQFRLKQYYLQTNFDNVFVMTLAKGKWTARYFDRNNGVHDRVVFTGRSVDQTGINALWQMMVENDVLTLPSQSALKDRLVGYEVDTSNLPYANMRYIDITDGAAYEFSLQSPTKQRHYSYHCPQAYLKQYRNVEELFHAVMLITLVEKFLGHSLRVC